MRILSKLAIASVLVAAVCGVFHPFGGGRWDNGVLTSDRTERQLIRHGAGQNDQNLKLLLAAKIFAGVGSVSDRTDHGDPGDRASSIESHGKPSS